MHASAGPRRIALVTTELGVGGAEKCVASLACGFDRRRFEPVVYCLAPSPEPPADALVRQLADSGVPHHFLGLRHVWQFASAVRRLKAYLASSPPDLVQTFLFHANVVGALAASRSGVPLVFTGLRVAERGAWRWWALRRIDRNVTRHVCVSGGVAEIAHRRGGLIPERTIVIPNGVDMPREPLSQPADLTRMGLPPGRRAITLVGRLHQQKGVDWLLKFMPRTLAELPDHDLLIVGTGPQARRMQRLANVLGIGDRVHFPGWCADVGGVLRASDLFVLPSRWEGMPNALLEAMANGLPAVAADVEGVSELLGGSHPGQVIRVGDAAAFSRQIVHWCRDRQDALKAGATNRRIAADEFSVQRMIERYQDLYESALQACP